VVVFNGDIRNRAYVVRSLTDELKIKSFLKMFYFAHFSILLLAMLVANVCATFFNNLEGFGRPAEHLLRTVGVSLGCYSLLVGVPYCCFGDRTRRRYPVLLRRKMKPQFQGMVPGENRAPLLSG
jgi:hypothetical protein